MTLLILGKNGQVGHELTRSLAPLGEVVALGRSDIDLTQPEKLAEVIDRVKPSVVINASAYTAVDKAETDISTAETVNTRSVAELARLAVSHGYLLVHYSTDYVFAGTGTARQSENDPTSPQSVYGRTKREGEIAIQSSGCRHLIFRTSWVHASRGANFIKTILRLARERDALSIVADQFGAPTSAELIADVTAHALRQTLQTPQLAGLYHLTSSGETSWFEYADFVVATAKELGVTFKLSQASISAIHTENYPQPARRPLNSRLDTSKLQESFGLYLPDWRFGVARTISELIETAS